MTEAFRKDTMRTMRKTMNRFCSILLIVALGVGFFAGVRATGDDMRDTASDYYIDYNAMDVKVLSTLGFSENDVAAVAAVDGVKQVYAGKYVDCLTLCHDNFLTRVFSLPQNPDSPETMNRLRVLEGQLPQAADECVIDEKIQYKYHFELGQTLSLGSADPTDDLENELEHTEYTIVGIVNSPMYLDMTRRGSTTVGDGSLDAYIYVPEENFTAEYYTELYVTAEGSNALNCYTDEYDELAKALKAALEPVGVARGDDRMEEMADYLNEKIPEARGKIADAEKMLEKLSPAEWYLYTRKELALGVGEFGDDAARIDNISTIFPVFFLAVAALVCLTTMARMVEEQRTEIGTLKALGYTDREIQKKYLIYSLSATVLGSGLGLAVGFKLFPTVIYDAYCIMYDLPPVEAPFHWGVAAICVVVALGCVTLVTCNVCHGVLSEMPANIMRPKAPPAGQRVLLEKVPFIWRRLSFSHKVTVRNLFRYKKRVLMTIVGIAGCAALVLTGYGLKDAINDIVQNQFQKVFRYDLLAGYSAEDEAEEQALFDQLESDPDIKEWMPQYRAAITAVDERHSYEVNLTVSQDYTRLTDFISLQERVSRKVLTPEREGAIITEKLGTMLGLKAGDTLTLRDGDNRTYELAIAGVSENYASHFVYISAEYYEEVFGKAPEYNTVIVDLADRDDWAAASEKLLAGGTVQMISSDAELVEQYKNVTDNLGYVVAVLIVSAGLLAFVVQYNLSNINITERTREIATLKVLGFYDGEVSAYIYRESVILTILGTGLGLLLGTALTRFVVATAEVDSIMFGRSIYWPSFLMAALITFLFSFLVNWVMHYRLKKINMVESMKSVD